MTKAPKAPKVAKSKPAEPTKEAIFSANLTVAQVLKQYVVLNVLPSRDAEIRMHESRLTVDRKLLPTDYEPKDGTIFSLVITRG